MRVSYYFTKNSTRNRSPNEAIFDSIISSTDSYTYFSSVLFHSLASYERLGGFLWSDIQYRLDLPR